MGANKVRAGIAVAVLALIGGLLAAPPASAYGQGWDYCSKASLKTSGKSVRIRGECNGGTLKLRGTFRKRSGAFDLRGRLGRDRVDLSGTVNNLVVIKGWIDDQYVDMDGSEVYRSCFINGWIGDEYDTGYPTTMIGHICGLLAAV